MKAMVQPGSILDQWVCGPGITNIGMTWELVRDENSQTPLHIYWLWNSEGGSSNVCFLRLSSDSDILQIYQQHTEKILQTWQAKMNFLNKEKLHKDIKNTS